MSRKSAEMLAREPRSNIKMADLAEWLKDLKAAHNVEVAITMELSGYDELAMWRFMVSAGVQDGRGDYRPLSQKSLVWPTASHKTVLGALLWLLVSLEDDIEADAALTGVRSAG